RNVIILNRHHDIRRVKAPRLRRHRHHLDRRRNRLPQRRRSASQHRRREKTTRPPPNLHFLVSHYWCFHPPHAPLYPHTSGELYRLSPNAMAMAEPECSPRRTTVQPATPFPPSLVTGVSVPTPSAGVAMKKQEAPGISCPGLL